MKFTDIKPFTIGSYEVDIPINHLKNALNSYNQDYSLELNPDFQRGNVWTQAQKIAYLEFFFREGRSAKTLYFNIGDWSEKKDSDIPQMVCVDGLQRLTAMLDFLNDKIPVFGAYFGEFEDKQRLNHFTFKFNINNLPYKKDVLNWYIEMNSGGTVHSTEEIERVRNMLKDLE